MESDLENQNGKFRYMINLSGCSDSNLLSVNYSNFIYQPLKCRKQVLIVVFMLMLRPSILSRNHNKFLAEPSQLISSPYSNFLNK
jgi:hypothetical protein